MDLLRAGNDFYIASVLCQYTSSFDSKDCHFNSSWSTPDLIMTMTYVSTALKFVFSYLLPVAPVSYTHLDVYKRQKALHSTTEFTFATHLIEANHTYKNIDNNT